MQRRLSVMNAEIKNKLQHQLRRYQELGVSEQIDYEKFYLYSIITHSTAIEGSTVTEVEAQLLFDEGVTSNKRTINEQLMNLDLKAAYDYGMKWIKGHEPITVDWLITLASKVMAHTGNEYRSLGGDFSAAKGELRKLNVTAGVGGRSYMSYQKVPSRLALFCEELNRRRSAVDSTDVCSVYELSFWAHFELVTIHPWADGNGRTCRLLMNLLQMEFGMLPSKVLREEKAEYIQSLIDAREREDVQLFINSMAAFHCAHLQHDIAQFVESAMHHSLTDKLSLAKELADVCSVKHAIAEKMADIFAFIVGGDEVTTEMIVSQCGFSPTTTKRYLRQLVEFGYIESRGANKNRTYRALEK